MERENADFGDEVFRNGYNCGQYRGNFGSGGENWGRGYCCFDYGEVADLAVVVAVVVTEAEGRRKWRRREKDGVDWE